MKNICTLICACFTFYYSATAQDDVSQNAGFSKDPRLSVDLSLASIYSGNAIAVGLHRVHPIAFNGRFAVGYGLRFTGFYGQDNGFVTAPASVSEGNFFKEQNEAKLDTLYIPHSSVGSLNAAIYLEYRFTDRISAEFNIDAVGFSFGADRSGRFEAASQGRSVTTEAAKVTPVNLLLTGDYDIGSLNSELSINIQLNEHLSVRPGLAFIFTEFTTYNALEFGNDRFRKKSLLPMLGVSYQL